VGPDAAVGREAVVGLRCCGGPRRCVEWGVAIMWAAEWRSGIISVHFLSLFTRRTIISSSLSGHNGRQALPPPLSVQVARSDIFLAQT
jgi:hypothetical protein